MVNDDHGLGICSGFAAVGPVQAASDGTRSRALGQPHLVAAAAGEAAGLAVAPSAVWLGEMAMSIVVACTRSA